MNLIKDLNNQVKLNIIDEINNLKNSISFSESIRKNNLSLAINENIKNYKINIKSKLQQFVYHTLIMSLNQQQLMEIKAYRP